MISVRHSLDFIYWTESKCEVTVFSALKGVKLALCGMECIDLMFNAIKILGVYDKMFKKQENLINLDLTIETLLRLWRMRNLSIASKNTVFKTLLISKIVHFALVKVIPIQLFLNLIK